MPSQKLVPLPRLLQRLFTSRHPDGNRNGLINSYGQTGKECKIAIKTFTNILCLCHMKVLLVYTTSEKYHKCHLHGISFSRRQYRRKSGGVARVGSSACGAGFETCANQRHQQFSGAATPFLHVCIDRYINFMYLLHGSLEYLILFGQSWPSVV